MFANTPLPNAVSDIKESPSKYDPKGRLMGTAWWATPMEGPVQSKCPPSQDSHLSHALAQARAIRKKEINSPHQHRTF